jgi:hypothetical protein
MSKSENWKAVQWAGCEEPDQEDMLSKEKPRLFQDDTTFGKLECEGMFIYKDNYAINTLAYDDDKQVKAHKIKMKKLSIYEQSHSFCLI